MKNILIGIGVFVLILTLAFTLKTKKGSEVTETTNPTNDAAQTQTVTTTKPSSNGTVKPTTPLVTNLFPQKGSYECKYEQATQSGRSSNTVYIANGKMRGEFRSVDAQGFGTLNMMVYDGTYLYTWIEGKATGVRTQPKSLSEIPAVFPTDIHEGRVLGSGINNVSWDCHAWSTVSSMLTKPSYVKF